jgi:hypothetical protein
VMVWTSPARRNASRKARRESKGMAGVFLGSSTTLPVENVAP